MSLTQDYKTVSLSEAEIVTLRRSLGARITVCDENREPTGADRAYWSAEAQKCTDLMMKLGSL